MSDSTIIVCVALDKQLLCSDFLTCKMKIIINKFLGIVTRSITVNIYNIYMVLRAVC